VHCEYRVVGVHEAGKGVTFPLVRERDQSPTDRDSRLAMVQPAPKAGGAGGEDVAVLKRVNQHASASTAEGAAHSESARDLTSGRNSPPTSRVDVHGEDDKGSDERPKGRKFYDLSGILKWWEALVILLTIAREYSLPPPFVCASDLVLTARACRVSRQCAGVG
jgi:hypothetical protein